MTVQALRDRARKALGRGHSKLKTKRELIEALEAAQKKVAGAAEKAATKVKEATGRTARAAEKLVESVRGRARRKGGGDRKAAAAGAGRGGARRAPEERRSEREPDPEGYIVARVAGEAAARGAPRPMTESAIDAQRPAPGASAPARASGPAQAPERDEGLADLPRAYGDDVLVALPRDPTTLFFYWDHGQETLRGAWQGLEGARPQLWIFVREASGAWTRLRTLDFALESRSYYVHDLEPGRVYRAEIHVVDRGGKDKILPRASNEMMLPQVGPSPVIDDRFMRILWGDPLQRLLRETKPGGAFPEEVRAQLARLSDWSRFQSTVGGGGQSAGGGAAAGGAGGIGGRPSSPWLRPSSAPSSPWGGRSGEGR